MYFSTILTFVATTLLAATTAQAGLFWITCNPIRLDGDNVLSATCRSDSGSDFRSVINLNTCVANNNGKLQCQSNGNYAASCTSCGLSDWDTDVPDVKHRLIWAIASRTAMGL
ncbi:putative effector protein [Ceratobasidium theobromae]|uniref:Putative effector protein n=1 Tax=Ceratobasidium theobromae TaxID=1582974 RepID=A0A5N5QIQ7_9AGAM|nr:putative effector protein [Ceratobasidium theobromae]